MVHQYRCRVTGRDSARPPRVVLPVTLLRLPDILIMSGNSLISHKRQLLNSPIKINVIF